MPKEKGQPGLEAHDDEEIKHPSAKVGVDRVFGTFRGKYFLIPESHLTDGVSMQFNNWTYRTNDLKEIDYLINRSQIKKDVIEIAESRQQEAIDMICVKGMEPPVVFQLMRMGA
jgi:hypothetical protein